MTKPWLVDEWCIPEAGCEFVWRMEDVLDVYHRPYGARYPVVGLDEKPVQLLSDARPPLPCRPGDGAKADYEYRREGTANVFCAFEPLANWRDLRVTGRRTRVDFAAFVKDLVDGRYNAADAVVLVMDNLNTHSPTSLYEAFGPEEARRITRRLENPLHAQARVVAQRRRGRAERAGAVAARPRPRCRVPGPPRNGPGAGAERRPKRLRLAVPDRRRPHQADATLSVNRSAPNH